MGDAYLAGQQYMLPCLGHGAVRGGYYQYCAVHLGGTGDHIFNEVGMSGAVDMSIMPLGGLVLNMGDGDGHTARLLFRGVIDSIVGPELSKALFRQDHGDCGRHGRLAVIYVTNGTYVTMGFRSVKFLLRHFLLLLCIKPSIRFELMTPFLPRTCSTS